VNIFAYTPTPCLATIGPRTRVYIYFFNRGSWQAQFLEADLKTPLPRKLTFTDPEKIRELARSGEAWSDSESWQMLEGCP
jgi:hypothetical protein